MALFFHSQYGEGIEALRAAFEPLHKALCQKYNLPSGPKDFDEALRGLEGSFVNIAEGSVGMINPSLRDYLANYLNDAELLLICARACRSDAMARDIWNFAIRYEAPPPLRATVAAAFRPLAEAFLSKDTEDDWLTGEVPWSRKIDLVLDWCEATGDGRFADIALEMARGGDAFLSAWQDGQRLAGLIQSLHDRDHEFVPRAPEIRDALVERLIDILETDLDSDELISIANEIDRSTAPDELNAALTAAIKAEFDSLDRKVAQMNSESSLSDHMDSLRTLAPGAGIPTELLRQAERSVEQRIERLEEEEPDEPPSVKQAATRPQAFGDEELNTLFSSLLSR